MKKRILPIILTLGLLLTAFAGCGGEPETGTGKTTAQTGIPTSSASNGTPGGPTGDASGSPSGGDSDSAGTVEEEIVLDYSDFIMPEETGSLTVYTTGMLGLVMNPAVERFRELYPNVTVNVQSLGDDEFDARIETEIPAGKGPDVLFDYMLPDMYKTIESGIFEDLNPYMQNDPDFHEEDYYDVLGVGLLNGVRGILPVEIELPILQTTEEALTDAGISREELRTWDGFMAAARRYKEQYPDNTVFSYGRDDGYLTDMVRNSGMAFVDYRNRVPAVDREQMKQLCDFCALDFLEGAQTELGNDGWYQKGGAVVLRKVLFTNFTGETLSLTMARYHHEAQSGENLIFEAVPDVNDGVTAKLVSFAGIPNSSPNKLNAWRLIKILLSDEIQGGSNPPGYYYLRIGFPVRRESMEKRIADNVRSFYADGGPEYEDRIERDIADISEVYGRMSGCSSVQSIVMKYIYNSMTPYLKGNAPFDKCFEDLYNTLELYASE